MCSVVMVCSLAHTPSLYAHGGNTVLHRDKYQDADGPNLVQLECKQNHGEECHRKGIPEDIAIDINRIYDIHKEVVKIEDQARRINIVIGDKADDIRTKISEIQNAEGTSDTIKEQLRGEEFNVQPIENGALGDYNSIVSVLKTTTMHYLPPLKSLFYTLTDRLFAQASAIGRGEPLPGDLKVDEATAREEIDKIVNAELAYNAAIQSGENIKGRLMEIQGIERTLKRLGVSFSIQVKNPDLALATDILGENPGIKLGSIGDSGTQIKTIFNYIITILFSLSGIAAVVMLVVQGTKLIYGQMVGSVAKKIEVMNKLRDLAIGLVLLLMSYLILKFINPDLLNPKLLSPITSAASIQYPLQDNVS